MWYNNHARALFLKGDKAMSEKRRDNRNRILHEGESTREQMDVIVLDM